MRSAITCLRMAIIHYTFYIIKLTRALKGQQRLAQGKRSDTLGQSTFVSDAL